MASVPRLVLAGVTSGVGKTVVTAGLIRALMRRGLRVAAFKAGPDFIDPSYLALAADGPCHNLDSWMIPRPALLELFDRAARPADLAIIEGMMGLFDGRGPLGDEGSTAEIARVLRAPVVLVADASRASRSIAALIRGYRSFDRRLRFAGVIANLVASNRHADWVSQAIRELSGAPCLGALPRGAELTLPSRHLGLVQAGDLESAREIIERAGDLVEQNLAVDEIITAAHSAPDLPSLRPPHPAVAAGNVRIGVARDAAFTFYYQANLDQLAQHGAEIVPFSPLSDPSLPGDIGGLYLGGGYPELHLEALSANQAMAESVRRAAGRGMPIYAECGGLMYLARGLRDAAGVTRPMVGLFDVDVRMEDRRTALGYATVTALRDSCILAGAEMARGHEFRWSRLEVEPPASECAYRVERTDAVHTEGLIKDSVLASYVHLHFASNPNIAPRFVEACRQWRKMAMIPAE